MMTIRGCLLVIAMVSFGIAYGQKDTAAVNALIEKSKAFIGSDSAQAVSLAWRAQKMANQIGYTQGEAYALKNVGMVYYLRGMYVQTLDYWNQSLQLFESIKDDEGTTKILGNFGAVYLNQGADDKALEYTLKALKLAEKIHDTLRIITASINVGSIYHNKKDPVALTYLLKALPLVESSKDAEKLAAILGNIGEIHLDNNDTKSAGEYFRKSIKVSGDIPDAAFSYNGVGKVDLREGKLDAALSNHNKALVLAEKLDDKFQVVRALRGIADVYEKKGNAALALENYNRARKMAEQMDDVKVELKYLYEDMASMYAKNKDFENAFLLKSLYSDIKDTLYNLETRKKLNQLQFDFELSKKEGEIVLQEAKIKSEKQIRIGVTIGLGLLLIIAFIIYRNYLQKSKINRILDKQKAQIEHLLLNILPKEVASELQVTGRSKPRHFEEVSVLFTDFKGFTSIADKMSPEAVVTELNECFMAFDGIMEKYNLEKIKTIGDAYMCAGNIPSPDKHHVYNMIKAGMEIQEFMEMYNGIRSEKGLEVWQIRIGVHVGPVVAGVVGKKKYAYDIWGSTVNIASRMESNGTPGKVNISADTYELIKDRFECSPRGKIYAKNLGELDMYFVEYEKTFPESEVVHADDKYAV